MTALLETLDRRFVAWAAAWTGASLLAFGLVSAILPNPVFGRQIPPEPFAIAVWLASGPLMGLVAATYASPSRSSRATLAPVPLGTAAVLGGAPAPVTRGAPAGEAEIETETPPAPQGTTLGTIAGFGAFLAIGCPVCNKIALLLLGTSGALTIYAPLQPVIGALSLALLAGTLAWRLRLRARGTACGI
jgi:hypothetical protein